MLKKCFTEDPTIYEIGVDEVGRGPLFGRVYTAAVVLPKEPTDFDFSLLKDSKKFSSAKKIQEVAKYIKEHALYWSINFKDEQFVDEVNILQATQHSMHASIRSVLDHIDTKETNKNIKFQLLIDGNYFMPFVPNKSVHISINTVVKGDSTYASIAAASILAKVERDAYIAQLCLEHPSLATHYGIDRNKGYGSREHLQGIQVHGITPWHRKTFGICKTKTIGSSSSL